MVTKIRKRFLDHKHNARKRGIKFHFSFDLWLDVWKNSGKLKQRGPYKGQYVMARVGDKGAYEIGNVKIIKAEDNVKEKVISKKTRDILRCNSLGHTLTKASREKIAAARRGKKLSAEHRAKLTKANIGRKHSKATREKMRKSALRIWKERRR